MQFEQLDVWKKSSRLSSELYKTLRELKDYGFRDQLNRAGLSVPSNISEGFERSSHKDCIRFLSYAKGSCGELRTQIYIGMDIGYIKKEIGRQWIEEAREISAMIGGLIKTKRKHLASRD